jgi:uncharacterized protein
VSDMEQSEQFDSNDSDSVNTKAGTTAESVLRYLAETLVDDAAGVEITTSQWRNRVSLNLSVAPGDMGKVIGRKGRTAQAIRTVVRAAGSRDGVDTFVDIVD